MGESHLREAKRLAEGRPARLVTGTRTFQGQGAGWGKGEVRTSSRLRQVSGRGWGAGLRQGLAGGEFWKDFGCSDWKGSGSP